MTFYLKYRPQNLEELDSNDAREALAKVLGGRDIPHAFLFVGPRGTGKTSAARIVAKYVNCEDFDKHKHGPCGKCKQCVSIAQGSNIDVIEIDAASHRGIDDIRAIKDAVNLSPARAKRKIYIIDEAHMLTVEASNALLKTLEEPPDHCIFILATTNPEKLLETIKSRTLVVNFKRATDEEISRSLARVAKREKIKVEDGVFSLLSHAASGSYRDAVKLFEQLSLGKEKVTLSAAQNYFASSNFPTIRDFFENLSKRKLDKLLSLIEGIVTNGLSLIDFQTNILAEIHKSLLSKSGIGEESLENFSTKELITLSDLISGAADKTKSGLIEQLPLEIAMVEWCGEQKPSASGPAEAEEKVEVSSEMKEFSEDVWKKVLASVKMVNTSVEALLRASRPIGFNGRKLVLGVFYKFHKERLEENAHRRILEDALSGLLNSQVVVECKLTEAPPLARHSEPVLTEGNDEDIIKSAQTIFGK